ncbi:MAG: DUF4131 domain-containing protein [Verrucomicrobiaceae bacterium]|nr:DUF4131 domain-containing protein [Verrucomicrobiaceae bacterium]
MKALVTAFLALRCRFGMFLRRAPLLWALLAGIAAVVAVDVGFPFAAVLVSVLSVAVGFVVLPAAPSRRVLVAGVLVAMVLLGWRHHQRLGEIHAFPFAAALAEGEGIAIRGEGWITDEVVAGARSVSTTLRIDRVVVAGHPVACDHRVPVWIQKRVSDLGYGARVAFTGHLLPLEGASGPGGFDAKRFYYRQSGSLARLEIREGDQFTLLPERDGSASVGFARRLRGKMESVLLLGIPRVDEPYARLIAAMTLGARENSPEELEEFFRISGTLHLFSVSGLHVGVVAGLLFALVRFLRLPRHLAVLVVIPCVLFYAVLTGLSPSAVRAAVMLAAFLAAFTFREKPSLCNSLGFAGLVILLCDSQQLFLPGFQLSFLIVFFIALLTSGLHERIARPLLADPFLPRSLLSARRILLDKAIGILAASLAISLSSWLGSAGLLAWHFQSISLVAVVANVFMVPFAGVIISLAAFSLIAGGLKLVWLAIAGNQANVWIATALTGLAQFFAAWPAASVNTGTVGGGGEKTPPPDVLRLDLMGDRGESAMLLSVPRPGGTPLHWMIDSGGLRTYRGQVLPLLRSRGINRLDALLLTHGDTGHIGAAPQVITLFRPPLLLESVLENRSPAHPEIVATAADRGVKTIAMERHHRLVIGDEVIATVLAPDAAKPGRLADDRALVLKFHYAGQTVLMSSDTGFAVASELLRVGADLRADLWIRGRHSDGIAIPGAFLRAVGPRAVLSSHADFPDEESIPPSFRDSLAEQGIPLFEIGPSGTISVEWSAAGLRIQPYLLPEKTLFLPAL